ncbi:WD40-repeat-containing domain protein [Radiomyces spectabilis]|uniref:WD40-repeat-containing domain protein n=1 Tax=Radiomyces spectabilis TaxID=64574 RepID=UPI00221E7930|nr:WD40-repeat-containing domain protein [Radiomyces spectabilis]KAI8379295.1 WD40-repeat-containing domain protein [Radiomyces spectabilis]
MWHPEKDGIMVYSNSYGNMGLYDVYNSKAIPFKGYHKQGNKQGGAPLLAWASSIPSVAETMASPWMMISYGVDDKMFVHDAENPSRRPVELIPYLQEKNPVWYESLLLNPERKRRRLATDDKSQYLAVGYTDGLVEIYRLDTLKIIFVSNALQGQISAMHWRYIRSTLYLAVGDTAGAVVVHSMATVDVNTDADIPVPTTTVHSTLSGHKGTITVLQWSAHQDTSYLASASADNLVYVWDIDKACRIAAFRNHRGNVQSLCWQLLDKDKLFSGANDRFIYSWKYTDYPYREEDGKRWKKKIRIYLQYSYAKQMDSHYCTCRKGAF